MSLVTNDTQYFIQYLDPLLIAKCSMNSSCVYLPKLSHFRPSDPRIPGLINTLHDVLRGGTPLAHYSDDYYIAFVHCKHAKPVWPYQISAYTSHIILLKNFRIVCKWTHTAQPWTISRKTSGGWYPSSILLSNYHGCGITWFFIGVCSLEWRQFLFIAQ